uniref:Germinal-center associated nuclear protein n=2 Tax=Nothobranchius furzeri TaxID=105023 RepID=A0A8C6NZW1_NOTFU
MNQSNPFGSPRGAFQAPNSSTKPSLFQTFGPQSSETPSQNFGFFQQPAFGQTNPPAAQSGSIFGQPTMSTAPAFGQPPLGKGGSGFVSSTALAFGQTSGPNPISTFGQAGQNQTPAFGQTSGQNQTPAFGQTSGQNQTPAFGQTSGQNQTPAFGQTSGQNQTPAFGQTGGQNQTKTFGQASGPNQNPFGQTPVFGLPSAFGPASGFGKPPPTYGDSQTSASSTVNFGQLPFGQPSSTTVFGGSQNVTQSRKHGLSEFCFKPANEAVFKPIFSASPESANLPITTMSNSSFGGSGSKTNSRGFPVLAGAKSGPLGFRFTQPAAPSVSSLNNPQTMTTSTGATNSPSFVFSQPASPSSSNTSSSTAEPTTPSSFSFTAKTLQAQPAPFLGATSFGQPPTFRDNTAKVESSSDNKESNFIGKEEGNIFARLGKAPKRKDDAMVSSLAVEKPSAEDDASSERDSPRHPSKRPLIRSRGHPGGLFSRALKSICGDQANVVKRDTTKETQKLAPNEEGEETRGVGQPAAPPMKQTLLRDAVEKAEASDSSVTRSAESEALTPVTCGPRRDSLDSLSGMSPHDFTSIMCRNVPRALNKKDVLEKHFSRFGKVCRIFCRPAKDVAIVHFDDHTTAVKAKKKGKMLHRHELLLLWQKKKQSPDETGRTPDGGQKEAEAINQEVMESKAASSPLRKPTLMPPALSGSIVLRHSSPKKKPYPVKLLQFDTEPPKDSTSESQSSGCPVPSSLVHLLGQTAETAEDKYRLLEQRDKILRQVRPKRTDLDLSKVFVGTCPDMCPEKERYMRETRNQLSVFEVIPETEMVDHATAIKEYSRSSADQEEPLPHELRPLPVLSMTMDYLVTQIMDEVQNNYRDWYDFVWNRTRGIRKDITQQRLCCPQTVSLIEKCTRFHVHCAHQLCEQPMLSFDAKINNENMTKCLQSLKEMYHDLAAEQIFCPQEAEFRQYSVLLRLNDGDVLREVQQFRGEVRNSPEVTFAVQAFAAVNSNNFVRFFKLVKRASYLSSCLLHRYFSQVRAKALKALNMAHTVGPRSTAFPIEDVVRMLMFRDATEGTDFVQQYGLVVNDGMVELSRIAFQEPELPRSQKMSEVILSKKTVLTGQVVNGGPLPNPPQHTPICSFDSQNKYSGDGKLTESTSSYIKGSSADAPALPAVDLSTQLGPDVSAVFEPLPAVPDEPRQPYHPEASQFQHEPVEPPSPPPKPPQPLYSDEDMVAAMDSVLDEVVEAEVKAVADAGASYVTEALSESSVQVEALVREVLGQMLQDISSNEIKMEQERVVEEKRRLEVARRRQEHEAFLAQFSCWLCTQIIHEVLDETIQQSAASQIQEAVNEEAERLAQCSEQVCCSLMEETLATAISLLAEDFLEAELERIHKYIKRWRDVVTVRRQLKRQMREFPAAPCCVDPRFKLKALVPSAPAQPSIQDLAQGLVRLGNAGVLAVSSTRLLRMREGAMHQMRVHSFYQQLLEEAVWEPLDLPALVTENIPNPPDRIFWKALVLLPSDDESVASLADRVLSDWMEVKLGGDGGLEEPRDGTMRTLCVSNTLQENGQRTHKVHITLKACRGPLSEPGLSRLEEFPELQGTKAIIMLLPAQPVVEVGQEDRDVPLLSALLQLKQLQQASSWFCPLPLVLLVPGCQDASVAPDLEEALKLRTLVKEELISEYMLFFIPETTNDLQGSKQLTQAVRWLLPRAPPHFPLRCQTLAQLIEASLSREFCPRVYANRQNRAAAQLLLQEPAPVIQLYNAVLDHVANTVASQDLCRLSWPPAEFSLPETREFVPHLGWNSVQHLAWLREAILSLQLPEWEELPATDMWSDLCSSIFCYASKITTSRRSQPVLVSHLMNLFERVRVKAQRAQASKTKGRCGNADYDAFSQVPWDDVVLVFVDHKLKDWLLPGPPVCEDAVTDDGEILVYFPEGSLEGFQPPEGWTRAVEQTHMEEKQRQRHGDAEAAHAPPAGPTLRQRLFHSLVEPAESSPTPLDITHTPTTEEQLAHKVLQNMERERAESRRSMEKLQQWVTGEPLDHLSTPLFIPSSILLSTPATIRCTPTGKTGPAALTQRSERNEHLDGATWSGTRPVSLTWRLKDLERQMSSSQEEELACRRKLRGLLSIVHD